MLRALECRSPCGGDMEGETRAVGREVSVQHSHRGRSRTWALKWALFLLFPPLPFLFLDQSAWMDGSKGNEHTVHVSRVIHIHSKTPGRSILSLIPHYSLDQPSCSVHALKKRSCRCVSQRL